MLKLLSIFLISALLFGCSTSKNTAQLPKENEISGSEKKEVAFGRIYMDASKEKVLGNFEKAGDLYKKALEINPRSAAANYELGNIYNFFENKNLAFTQYKIATELDPENFWYKLSYATILKAQGKMDLAITEFEELVEQNPNRIELKYELSQLLLNNGKKEEGILFMNKIEDEIGVTEEVSFLKQRVYLSENNVDAAAKEIEKLIETYPKELRYYGVLADIYSSNGEKKKALDIYQKMQQLDSTNYRLQFSLAEFYRTEGNSELYLKNIKKAFANSEMNIDDKVKYVLTFYQVDSKNVAKKEEGIALCKKIVEGHPTDAKSYALLADFLYFDEQLEQSKQAYFKTIELDSSRYPVWNQLLVILSETGDTVNSLKYGARAVELFPNQPTVYLLYGLALSQNNQHWKAIEYLDLGKDMVIDNQALKSQIYSSIGDSYHTLKEHEKSDESYDKALTLDPNNVYVLNNFSYYLSLRKVKLEKAKAMSAKSNNLAPNQSSFQDTYAWILFQMEEYEEAEIWINKAIDSDVNPSAVLLEHKGDILYKLGNIEGAIEFWKKAQSKKGASELIDKKVKEGKYYE